MVCWLKVASRPGEAPLFDMLGIPSLSELARWELKAHFEIQGSACVGLEASGGLSTPRFLQRKSCAEEVVL